MRRVLAVLMFVVAACAGDDADVTTGSAATASPTTVTTTTAPAAAEPLRLGVSVHVEGYERSEYERHRAVLEDVVAEAEAAGVVLTFELGRPFAEASFDAGDGWVAQLPDRGQAVGVHADLGFPPAPPRQMERRLAEHKALVERLLGAPVTHVSGVCSEAPWIEPLAAAGFTAVAGIVAFCLKSLETIPPEYDADRIDACATPADCHDPVPTDDEHARPWRTSTSADWLSDDPTGQVWLLPGGPMPDGAAVVAALLAEAVEEGRPMLAFSWSIGAPPPPGFVTELADVVAALGDAVRWTSVADLAR